MTQTYQFSLIRLAKVQSRTTSHCCAVVGNRCPYTLQGECEMVPPHVGGHLGESPDMPHALYPAVARLTATPAHTGNGHIQGCSLQLVYSSKNLATAQCSDG